jgi:hypothetical protein
MVDEILAHQLVDDPVVRVILELVLEPAYDLRCHPPSTVVVQQIY